MEWIDMEWIDSFHDLVKDGGHIAWWQMTVTGVLVFFYGLALLRLAGQRHFGKLAAFDIVLAVLIASNLSRTLTANAPLVGGLVKGEVVQLRRG